MDHKNVICNNSYIPNTAEYMEALGPYGASVMVIGGLISVGLYVLFFEQVFFTQTNAHRIYRRHIFWIASVYPLMAALSVLSLLVPRANDICTAVKITYMSVGISHFTDLTLLMFGGEEVLLQTMAESRLNLQVGPSCCCCLCLPSPPVSK
ncbi:hypothetical protein Pcinc_039588 [Petrolisthes cinctipes]|uniref:Organic solute transporter subunit alpha n=1 Tax=Petrolisthes cinctipes TaxID=88211 RepID=A0AAE1BRD8_PETCI|nr:hypothetical protein Pcinc_039588 [Petrolisthes cinctipes]